MLPNLTTQGNTIKLVLMCVTALHCPVAPAGPSPPQHTTLDLLLDFASSAPEDMTTEIDRKPTAQDLLRHDAAGSQVFKKRTRQGAVPYYAFDWAPGLPASWMLLEQNEEVSGSLLT